MQKVDNTEFSIFRQRFKARVIGSRQIYCDRQYR